MPGVSVILPAFDRLAFLEAAIDSVLAQTHADWELVIADDGSAPQTRAYLQGVDDARVRILWLAHCGNPGRVRNAALASATGRYVAFLDSDDVWAANKLEKQIAALADAPACRWSYTGRQRIDAEGRLLASPRAPRSIRGGWIFADLLTLEFAIPMPTVVAERSLVREIGGFDERLRFGEFHDLCLRLAMRSAAVALDEPLCGIRAHDRHYSDSDRAAAFADWMRLYEKFASLAPTARLRSECARLRTRWALDLARLQGENGHLRMVCRTLRAADVFRLRQPELWMPAMRALMRPLVPAAWKGALRRRRARSAGLGS
jgi:glycosyltransferase involved in cell wall biosynthesis